MKLCSHMTKGQPTGFNCRIVIGCKWGHQILVGGLEYEFYFSIQLGISSAQLTYIFFRGVAQPLNHQPELVCLKIGNTIPSHVFIAIFTKFASGHRIHIYEKKATRTPLYRIWGTLQCGPTSYKLVHNHP